MATTYGMLTAFDSDYAFVNTVGQDVVYEMINELLARHNEVLRQSIKVFVEKETPSYRERYYAPMGGQMQTLGRQAAPAARKRTGHWDVGFPLIGIGDRLAGDRVDMGYLTAGQLEAQIKSIIDGDRESVRTDLLTAIFVDNARVFADPIWGNVTVEPLANGDAVVYPPVIGAAAGAVDNHYLQAAFSAANLTAAQNELMEHFGWDQGGENAIVFCHPTEGALIAALAGFIPYPDRFASPISVGATWTQPTVPDAPGITIGRMGGFWINVWQHMPVHYMILTDLDAPAPLYVRKDPAETGLGSGLQLVSTDEEYPIKNSFYEHRYGFGASNRLNGVVWLVAAGAGGYTPPALFNFFRYASS